jgi:hypothetical protein
MNRHQPIKYRKKPVVVEAWQWNGLVIGEDIEDVRVFLEQWGCWVVIESEQNFGIGGGYYNRFDYEIYIETLEGRMHVSKGDYVIRGIKNEFYPCKPDVFVRTYELVGDEEWVDQGVDA